MKTELRQGERVRILAHWNWPQTCTGRIAVPPHASGDPEDGANWRGCRRVVPGRNGPIEFYWVTFDKPQMDGDGDGPYLGGEVETEYLRLLES